VPIEGEGIVDETSWSALPNTPVVFEVKATIGGDPTTRVIDNQGNPVPMESISEEARELFHEFEVAVLHWVEIDNRFRNPTATLAIEPWTYLQREEAGETQVVTGENGQPEIAIKRATVTLVFESTDVDENTGAITPRKNARGEQEYSTSQQTDFLHRDSHHDQLEDKASSPRQASR
jgi:hypothetical protein